MLRLLILLIFPVLAIVAACGEDGDEENNGSGGGATATRAATPDNGDEEEEEPETPTASPDVLATVCQENPDPSNDEQVQVEEPLGGDQVTSPLTVRGQVAAFEATFKMTLFDASGTQIADVTAMSAEGQTLAPFEADITFSVTQETPACLWVYEASAMDGSPIHVFQIPLRLQP